MNVSKQHYVPKFYLKNFENAEHLIERLDVKNASLLKSIGRSGLCYEKYFYGLITGVSDPISQYVEKSLKRKEDVISRELPRLINLFLSNERITPEDKQLVAFFIVMQHFRSPIFREQLNEMMQSGLEQMVAIVKNLPKESISKFFSETFASSLSTREIEKIINGNFEKPNYNNLLHLKMMNEMIGFSNLLWGQDWIVYKNNTSKPFVTSDNPVGIEPLERKGFYHGGFMDYTYHFSLSPSLHIVTRPPKVMSLEFSKVHRQTLTNEIDILKQNFHIMNSCQQYVFADSKAVLKELREVILKCREIENKAK